jgi:hypothetical protein
MNGNDVARKDAFWVVLNEKVVLGLDEDMIANIVGEVVAVVVVVVVVDVVVDVVVVVVVVVVGHTGAAETSALVLQQLMP